MSEYCEYMWCDPARGHNSTALTRSIYDEGGKLDKRDKKLAIKTVRAILREMPDVGKKLHTQDAFTNVNLSFSTNIREATKISQRTVSIVVLIRCE